MVHASPVQNHPALVQVLEFQICESRLKFEFGAFKKDGSQLCPWLLSHGWEEIRFVFVLMRHSAVLVKTKLKDSHNDIIKKWSQWHHLKDKVKDLLQWQYISLCLKLRHLAAMQVNESWQALCWGLKWLLSKEILQNSLVTPEIWGAVFWVFLPGEQKC